MYLSYFVEPQNFVSGEYITKHKILRFCLPNGKTIRVHKNHLITDNVPFETVLLLKC